MDFANIIVGFVSNYIAGNIPPIKNKSLKMAINDCYNKALHKWKCDAVIDKYKDRSFDYIDELKEYVIGNAVNLDNELALLLSHWVEEMMNDQVCSNYLLNWKMDSLQSNLKFANSVKKRINKVRSKNNKVTTCINQCRLTLVFSSNMEEQTKDALLQIYNEFSLKVQTVLLKHFDGTSHTSCDCQKIRGSYAIICQVLQNIYNEIGAEHFLDIQLYDEIDGYERIGLSLSDAIDFIQQFSK